MCKYTNTLMRARYFFPFFTREHKGQERLESSQCFSRPSWSRIDAWDQISLSWRSTLTHALALRTLSWTTLHVWSWSECAMTQRSKERNKGWWQAEGHELKACSQHAYWKACVGVEREPHKRLALTGDHETLAFSFVTIWVLVQPSSEPVINGASLSPARIPSDETTSTDWNISLQG